MKDAFFTLHADLPRGGPGDRASLDWALDLAGVAKDARILDAGRGPGANEALAKVLNEAEREAALWRAHCDQFGYALAVVRPR